MDVSDEEAKDVADIETGKVKNDEGSSFLVFYVSPVEDRLAVVILCDEVDLRGCHCRVLNYLESNVQLCGDYLVLVR